MSDQSLVVVCGPPGVGKSTVGAMLADRLGAERLRTDAVRRDVVPDPSYTDRERRRVYDEFFDRARELLDGGASVVLDGTFQYESTRDRAAELATEFDVEFDVVRVTCDEATVRERLAERTDDPSDAVFANYREIRDAFDPFDRPHLTVDNSGTLEQTSKQLHDRF